MSILSYAELWKMPNEIREEERGNSGKAFDLRFSSNFNFYFLVENIPEHRLTLGEITYSVKSSSSKSVFTVKMFVMYFG